MSIHGEKYIKFNDNLILNHSVVSCNGSGYLIHFSFNTASINYPQQKPHGYLHYMTLVYIVHAHIQIKHYVRLSTVQICNHFKNNEKKYAK